MRAYATGFQSVDDFARELLYVISDRYHPHLFRRQPERERAGVVLDQSADEALHRPDEHAMQHCRPMRSVVRTRVLDSKSLRQIEIQLHRRTLPFASDRIDQLEVQFGAIEYSAANVVGERLTAIV